MRAFSRAWPALFALRFLAANAAFITYDNCLDDHTLHSNPLLLQFTPYFVNATFDATKTSHTLELTVYGNVSGQQIWGTYPPPNSSHWSDNGTSPQAVLGKIADVDPATNLRTTLTSLYEVVTYTAFENKTGLCQTLNGNTSCPLIPAFFANGSDPNELPSFFLSHDFGSSYAFSTISTTLKILSNDKFATVIGCVSVQITPDLGENISGMLTWLPLVTAVLKGIATIVAAIWSPWGSSDIFRWTSNYGRDEDLLRLVTPGFGDCLQYIQFIVLTGGLTLNYPGFYQPAVSQASWSTLLFNESFVSSGDGTRSLQDGIYTANATYGMTQLSQLIGMTEGKDVWACMATWLLVITGIVILVTQLGFFSRWIYLKVTNTTEEDLRRKNLPFTIGNLNRLLFNFFILPIVSISLYQLVIAPRSPTGVVASAVVVLAIMIIAAAWILRVIFVTKPKTLLFDDLPIVLMYGPLYNTYSDSAAPFALVPTGLTFMRGVAIGAVQPSGIAQLIILAICEVVLLLTLNGFRPFQGQTSMNVYHTVFSGVRVVTILLMVAFVPSLGVTEGSKGWIGYAILILHGLVLVLGFFLNSAQTIIEVVARALGAGGDSRSGAVRGSILSLRMLKRRRNRTEADRNSMMSSAAILRDDAGAGTYGGRSRSISASSNQLLNRMSGFENFNGEQPITPDTLDAATPVDSMTNGATDGNATKDVENYYRPPRPRKATLDALTTPGTKTRSGSDFPYADSPAQPIAHSRVTSAEDGHLAHDSPAPAYFRDRADSGDQTNTRTDYAVREVDQYYRGEALNHQPTRKLKTGPASPNGPAATAQSWLERVKAGVTGKKKDQSKGFEVVRSNPAPMRMGPAAEEGVEMQDSPAMHQQEYRDSPPTSQRELQVAPGAARSFSPVEDLEDPRHSAPRTFSFGFNRASEANFPAPFRTSVRPESETVPQLGVLPQESSWVTYNTVPARERRPSEDSVSDYNDTIGMRGITALGTPSLAPPELGRDHYSRTNWTTASNHPSAPRLASRAPSTHSGIDLGQDWLQAVDALSWQQPSSRDGSALPATTLASAPPTAPGVPRRNSRRESQRYQPQDSVFEGFDSGAASGSASPPDMLGPPAGDERPHSFTNASHKRAADSITRNSFGASAAMHESAAEYFSGSMPKHNGGYL